jgi:hypothetical protein
MSLVSATSPISNNIFFFFLKPEARRPLGRQRRRWVESIKKDLREIEECV